MNFSSSANAFFATGCDPYLERSTSSGQCALLHVRRYLRWNQKKNVQEAGGWLVVFLDTEDHHAILPLARPVVVSIVALLCLPPTHFNHIQFDSNFL